ncbi:MULTISPECIES: glycosyltransferase family 2 protein [unclassified Campylobacter]|uniref:glycosyltransferase family 2 protein n=1 Tax=unclassified Campylobacter TaxID=2593542 RepID=UPI0012381B47|nr:MULTISPECIES: glycosyltransferase family 2 protein [unclassified Campylobacter]KAA6225468.1 glycosyltransferase family 2 protein [Campylobacter sp. LR196d]KAA6227406.1 glycosyltransferase family 2 protein [Campylobacter sp. LR185c]KAA6229739.1 glycosyltransferase family 2 protein [Campylobacter sp. LR286c]KAA6234264.1 glycosyltransferase family 2 protein [Campylobacter sp. LR291e]KAA6234482.1 glycosyltransferase family 2 protein [Campylobacter sp. LR264d]
MPKLSVIIPTYKRPKLLSNAVKSVQNQNIKDIQIIISDDNSNDETSDIVKALQKEDSRIEYVLNKKYKSGPNGNKNNGFDYVRGEFVCFLDDDDMLLENAFDILFEKINQGYSHVFGNCFFKRGEILSNEFSGYGFDRDCEVSKKDFLTQKFIGEFFSIFKKSLLDNNRFNDEFYGNEAILWVNLYKEKSFYIHKALRIYTINQNTSVTTHSYKHALRVFKGYLEMARIIEEELIKTGDKDYKKACAKNYQMAAYYAKFAKEYKLMYKYLFKSLSLKMDIKTFILLSLSIMPNSLIKFLSRIRAKL